MIFTRKLNADLFKKSAVLGLKPRRPAIFPTTNTRWACQFDILFSIFVRNSMLSKNVINESYQSPGGHHNWRQQPPPQRSHCHYIGQHSHLVKSGREHAEKTISTNGKNNFTLTKSVWTILQAIIVGSFWKTFLSENVENVHLLLFLIERVQTNLDARIFYPRTIYLS